MLWNYGLAEQYRQRGIRLAFMNIPFFVWGILWRGSPAGKLSWSTGIFFLALSAVCETVAIVLEWKCDRYYRTFPEEKLEGYIINLHRRAEMETNPEAIKYCEMARKRLWKILTERRTRR